MKSPEKDTYDDFWTISRDALEYSLEKLNVSVSQRQQDDLMNGWLKLRTFPDVKESLAKLKQKYKLAVISNGEPRMLREVFKSNEMDDLVDPANEFSVDEVRVFKPHPAVYDLAKRKLGVLKSEILFVSGLGWDVIGAKEYGYQSVWLNRNGEPKPRLGASADLEFSNLNQLVQHLN